MEVLKLQSRIEDTLRSPSYSSSFQHMIKVHFFIGVEVTGTTIATVAHSPSFQTELSISSETLYEKTLGILTTQSRQLASKIRKKSVSTFSSK